MPKKAIKMTAAVEKRIAKAIRMGATYAMAAQYGGISYHTFRLWMNEGEKPDASDEFRDFHDAIRAAEAHAVVHLLSKIEAAASSGTWQAAAWKLERRYPHDYGRNVHEVTGRDGGPIETKSNVTVDYSKLSTEQLEQLIAIAESAQSED